MVVTEGGRTEFSNRLAGKRLNLLGPSGRDLESELNRLSASPRTRVDPPSVRARLTVALPPPVGRVAKERTITRCPCSLDCFKPCRRGAAESVRKSRRAQPSDLNN